MAQRTDRGHRRRIPRNPLARDNGFFDITRPLAIPAERIEIEGRSGRLSHYVAGKGPPLLLVHSIHAAGWTREVQPAQFFRSWDAFLSRP